MRRRQSHRAGHRRVATQPVNAGAQFSGAAYSGTESAATAPKSASGTSRRAAQPASHAAAPVQLRPCRSASHVGRPSVQAGRHPRQLLRLAGCGDGKSGAQTMQSLIDSATHNWPFCLRLVPCCQKVQLRQIRQGGAPWPWITMLSAHSDDSPICGPAHSYTRLQRPLTCIAM